MGAGLLPVKSGFILFIKSYQFPLQINTIERERERWRRNLTTVDVPGVALFNPSVCIFCTSFFTPYNKQQSNNPKLLSGTSGEPYDISVWETF